MTAVAPAIPAAPGLWTSVWKLLRLRLVILVSGLRRAKGRRLFGLIVLGLVVLSFIAFLLVASFFLLRFMRSPQFAAILGDIAPMLESIPVLVLGGAFLGILLTSFGLLLQALYLAGDMDFLLAAPIPIRAVFLSKLLQAILPNFSLIAIFALPLLWGLGLGSGYNLFYYPLVIVMLAALALAAAGLSSLLVLFVVRIFPARRVAEVIGFFGAIISLICSQSGQLANFENVSSQQAAQAVGSLSRFDSPWSPLAWAGRGLVALGEGRWLPGIGFTLLALGVCALVFTIALTTAERLYYSGWASMQGVRRKKKAPPRRAAVPATDQPAARLSRTNPLERLVPPVIRAILVKDYYVHRRDLRNLSQLVTPLIFGVIYALMFLRGGGEVPAGRGEAPPLFMEVAKNLFVYGNVGISLLVSWMLLQRLAGMGISQEGRSYWLLKSAPISPIQLLSAKFLVAFLPSLALGWLFLLAISLLQGVSPGTLLYLLAVVALITAGNTGVNLVFGVLGARFDWEDPRQMVRGATSCLGSLASIAFLPLTFLLFFGPPILFALLSQPEILGQVVGLLLGGAFCLASTFLPPWLVRTRIPTLAET